MVSIKALLESLTQWSKATVDEGQVSDVYVRLGNDFNAAVAAFGAFGIDMRYVLPPVVPFTRALYKPYPSASSLPSLKTFVLSSRLVSQRTPPQRTSKSTSPKCARLSLVSSKACVASSPYIAVSSLIKSVLTALTVTLAPPVLNARGTTFYARPPAGLTLLLHVARLLLAPPDASHPLPKSFFPSPHQTDQNLLSVVSRHQAHRPTPTHDHLVLPHPSRPVHH